MKRFIFLVLLLVILGCSKPTAPTLQTNAYDMTCLSKPDPETGFITPVPCPQDDVYKKYQVPLPAAGQDDPYAKYGGSESRGWRQCGEDNPHDYIAELRVEAHKRGLRWIIDSEISGDGFYGIACPKDDFFLDYLGEHSVYRGDGATQQEAAKLLLADILTGRKLKKSQPSISGN